MYFVNKLITVQSLVSLLFATYITTLISRLILRYLTALSKSFSQRSEIFSLNTIINFGTLIKLNANSDI